MPSSLNHSSEYSGQRSFSARFYFYFSKPERTVAGSCAVIEAGGMRIKYFSI